MIKGYVDSLGKSLYSLTSYELVSLYKKCVERDTKQQLGKGFIMMDTHKDIQLIENEFVRRFHKLDNYIEMEREQKEIQKEDMRKEP